MNDAPFSQSNVGINPVTGSKAISASRYPASRDGNIGVFVQDDWKMKSNLTLNYGLRWESFGNPQHRHNSTSNVFFQGGNDFNSRIAGAKVDYTPNHHLLEGTDWNNFAPRFGFAGIPPTTAVPQFAAAAGCSTIVWQARPTIRRRAIRPGWRSSQ